MPKVRQWLVHRLQKLCEDGGPTAVEYAMMLGLIAAAIGSVMAFGQSNALRWDHILNALSRALSS